MRRSELCAMSRTVLTLVVLAVCVWGAAPVLADDWPQWRGAGRFGVWHETGIIDEFPESGLKVTWRVPINSGFSGPVVATARVRQRLAGGSRIPHDGRRGAITGAR